MLLRGVRPYARDVSQLKGFLQLSSDRSAQRRFFGARSLRQCVFIVLRGSHDLAEAGEGRLFWPVIIKQPDVEAIMRDREQLWAEAAALFAGPKVEWRLPCDLERMAKVAGAHCRDGDERLREAIENWFVKWIRQRLETAEGETMKLSFSTHDVICGADLWVVVDHPRNYRALEMNVARILSEQIGAERTRNWHRRDGRRGERGWILEVPLRDEA